MKKSVFLLVLAGLASSSGLAQELTPTAAGADPGAAPLVEPLAAPTETSVVAPVVTPVVVAPELPAAAPVAAPAAAAVPAPVAAPALALAPPQPLSAAGHWEGDLNAGFSLSSGNTDSQSLNLGGDVVYQRPDDKLSLSGQYLESRSRSVSNGVVTTSLSALQWRIGGRYDRDITPTEFGFVGLEFSQDQIRQLALRSVISSGLGRHLVKSAQDQWDVYGGLTYREDLYYPPGVLIDNSQQTRFDTVETLFGEESSHRLTETARFKQKFVLYPGILNSQGTRAAFDAGLLVDINKTLSLSVKLQARYDSLAEAPVEKYDLLFLTGLSVKFRN